MITEEQWKQLEKDELKAYDELLDAVEVSLPSIRKKIFLLKTALYAACLKQANLESEKADELYKKYLVIANEFYLDNQDYFDEQFNNS